jgi:CDP-diacylglycerol--serine O-phosphatidyltransferase
MVAIRYAIPNLLTAASFLLGLGAIISAEQGQLERAGWLIVWCVLLDVADGMAARLLKATSEFGAELDSFADLVAFGLAPAALVLHYIWQYYPGVGSTWIAAACAIYALFAGLRLARFNTSAPVTAGWFRGVPTTACGAVLATGVILLVRYEPAVTALNWPLLLSVLIAIMGVSMISNLQFPKLALSSNRWVNIPHVANILGLYICGTLRIWPEYQFGCALLVIVVGVTSGLLKKPTGQLATQR